MDSKTRSSLSAMANGIDAIFQIGKGNLNENMLKSIGEALFVRELIKITVLKGCEYSAKELMYLLEGELKAEGVRAIGNKIILYKKSDKKDIKHILD